MRPQRCKEPVHVEQLAVALAQGVMNEYDDRAISLFFITKKEKSLTPELFLRIGKSFMLPAKSG